MPDGIGKNRIIGKYLFNLRMQVRGRDNARKTLNKTCRKRGSLERYRGVRIMRGLGSPHSVPPKRSS